MRTTSSLESFNAYLNRTIPKRGNLFKFMSRLKYHECRKADRMHNLVHNFVPQKQFERKTLKDRLREAKIEKATDLLSKGASIGDFLNALANEENSTYDIILAFKSTNREI